MTARGQSELARFKVSTASSSRQAAGTWRAREQTIHHAQLAASGLPAGASLDSFIATCCCLTKLNSLHGGGREGRDRVNTKHSSAQPRAMVWEYELALCARIDFAGFKHRLPRAQGAGVKAQRGCSPHRTYDRKRPVSTSGSRGSFSAAAAYAWQRQRKAGSWATAGVSAAAGGSECEASGGMPDRQLLAGQPAAICPLPA